MSRFASSQKKKKRRKTGYASPQEVKNVYTCTTYRQILQESSVGNLGDCALSTHKSLSTFSEIQRLVEHVEAELSGLTIQEVRQSLDGTDDYDSGKKFIKNYLQEQENNEAEEREQDEAWFRGNYSLLTKHPSMNIHDPTL